MADSFGELMLRVRSGEQDAARELMQRYGEAVRREIRFRLRDVRLIRVVSESDVFQSAVSSFFVGLQLGRFDVRQPEDLVALLKTIAERRVCSEARFWHAERRDVRRNVELSDVVPCEPQQDDPSPSAVVSERELVAEALARLPETTLHVIELRRGGLRWDAIAERLPDGGTPEAVRKRYERDVARVTAELGLRDY